eukprot:TRINITY_DN1088_c0_g1_i3.p1 TRINITY_DN1088_c0_g1~~TRINITY_DN1088_c0_g1_i3.p1  ORF type:complete len:2114 (+),score=348.03 TRINITY_DN1088_c0_g1_i3:402-6344(+)
MHCPDMGCDLSYNTTSKMTSCVPFGDACTMHANAEDCTTNGLCAWDQGTLTCAPKALADIECPDVPLLSCMRNGCGLRRNECIECDSIVEKDQCTTVSGCSWTNQVCMPEDRRAVGCSFISEAEQCKADKSCHFTAGKQCVDKSSMDCILKETEAECTTAGESCSWNGQCITNWAEACSALSADGCAYRPDCAWGQGACEAIPPMAACKARTVNKEVCEALPGCTFFPDPEDEDGDCVSGIFDFDDGVCSDMNEATCRNPANKCHWAAKSNACVPAVCSIMGEDDCAKADHCQERNGLCVPANLNLATAKECTLADFSTACQGRMCEGVSDVWATNNGAPRPLNMVPQNSKTPPFVTQLWEMAVMNTECSVEALLTDRCDLCREGYIMNDLVPVRCERDNVYVEGELCVMPLPTMDCPFKASCFTDKPDPGPNPGGPMTGCTGLDQATCVAQPVDDPYGDGAEYRPCEWVYGSCQEKQWKAAGCYKRDATSCEGAVDGQNPYSLSCFMHENKCKIRDQQACDADTGAGLPTNVALASLLSFCNDCDIWPTGTGYRCQTYRCTSTALKADCSGSCQYDDATLTCNDVEACNKKSLMACSYHLPCGLKGDACIPCSEMVTEPACSDTMGCAWDGGVCKGSERRGCEEREDEASCASGDRCVWVAPFNHCKEKDDVSCFGLPKEACGFRDANAQPCVWLDEMATSDPACVPNVDGAQCADLALEHCVFREDCVQKDGKCAAGVLGEACDRVGDHPGCNYFPGCTLISTPFGEYECKAGVVDFAVAPAGECKSITDMAECAALPNCFVAPFTFDTGPGTQVTVYGCAPLLCDTLDATRCRAAGKCDWEAGLCVPKGFDVTTAPATCNRLNLATACNGGTAPCANVQTMWSSAQHELAYRSSPAGRPYLPPLIQNWAALQVLPPRVDGCTLAMMSAGECDFCTPGFVEFPFLPVDCDAAGNMIIHGQICIKPEAPTACPFKMSCSEEAPCEMRAPTAADCSAERCELKDGACLTKGAGGAKPPPTSTSNSTSTSSAASSHPVLAVPYYSNSTDCSVHLEPDEHAVHRHSSGVPTMFSGNTIGACMPLPQPTGVHSVMMEIPEGACFPVLRYYPHSDVCDGGAGRAFEAELKPNQCVRPSRSHAVSFVLKDGHDLDEMTFCSIMKFSRLSYVTQRTNKVYVNTADCNEAGLAEDKTESAMQERQAFYDRGCAHPALCDNAQCCATTDNDESGDPCIEPPVAPLQMERTALMCHEGILANAAFLYKDAACTVPQEDVPGSVLNQMLRHRVIMTSEDYCHSFDYLGVNFSVRTGWPQEVHAAGCEMMRLLDKAGIDMNRPPFMTVETALAMNFTFPRYLPIAANTTSSTSETDVETRVPVSLTTAPPTTPPSPPTTTPPSPPTPLPSPPSGCTAQEIVIGGACHSASLIKLRLRLVDAIYDDVMANVALRGSIAAAVCADVAATVTLAPTEVCNITSYERGSVIANVAITTTTASAEQKAVDLTQALAAGTFGVATTQVSGALDRTFDAGTTVGGIAINVPIACNAFDCNAHGVPSGMRPDCTCACVDGYRGAACEQQPMCAGRTAAGQNCGGADGLLAPSYRLCEAARCQCMGRGSVFGEDTQECTYGDGVTCAVIADCQAKFDTCMERNSGLIEHTQCTDFRMRCCEARVGPSGRECRGQCRAHSTRDNDDDGLEWWGILLIVIGTLAFVLVCCCLIKHQSDARDQALRSPPRRATRDTEPASAGMTEGTLARHALSRSPAVPGRYAPAVPSGPYDDPYAQAQVQGLERSPQEPPLYEEEMQPPVRPIPPEWSRSPHRDGVRTPADPRARSRPYSPVADDRSRSFSGRYSPILGVQTQQSFRPACFRDGHTGKAITVIGCEEGRAMYKVGEAYRPSFTEAVYEPAEDALRLPELNKSITLPLGAVERVDALDKLRELFDGCGVRHNLDAASELARPASSAYSPAAHPPPYSHNGSSAPPYMYPSYV